MVILEGLQDFIQQTLGQLFPIPLTNTLGYVYTILNLLLQFFGFNVSPAQ